MTGKKLFTVAVGDPTVLGELLAARLGVGHAAAVALVARGAVHVDGKRASDATRAVAEGAKLKVYLPDSTAPPGEFRIAHEDAWVVVVDKPVGVPSQATRADSAGSLDALVQRRFSEARMMHRLDRDASGLVLFARVPEARAPLQAALERGAIERRYLALVAGRLEGEGRIALRIARDPRDERRRIAHPEPSDAGEAAASRWRAIAHGETSTALELQLETGRTHQLRVHLQAIGHSILGDRLYGGAPFSRLCLHAAHLSLRHPRDRRRLKIESPPPLELPIATPP